MVEVRNVTEAVYTMSAWERRSDYGLWNLKKIKLFSINRSHLHLTMLVSIYLIPDTAQVQILESGFTRFCGPARFLKVGSGRFAWVI